MITNDFKFVQEKMLDAGLSSGVGWSNPPPLTRQAFFFIFKAPHNRRGFFYYFSPNTITLPAGISLEPETGKAIYCFPLII